MLPWTDRSSARDSGLPKKWLVRERRRKFTKQITLLDGGLTGMEFKCATPEAYRAKGLDHWNFTWIWQVYQFDSRRWILDYWGSGSLLSTWIVVTYDTLRHSVVLFVYGLLGQTAQMIQRLEVDGVTRGTSTKRTSTKRLQLLIFHRDLNYRDL